MKKTLLNALTAVILLMMPNLIFAQAPPLGTAADFALFTTVGAVTNIGTYKYLTHITGNVGTNSGSSTNFGNVNGVMHNDDGGSATCSADLLTAFNALSAAIPTDTLLNPVIGSDTTLHAGIYFLPGSTMLDSFLTLDAQGNANAVFIFKTPTDVAYSLNTSVNSKVKLVNGAKACNVFWQFSGAVNLAAGTTIAGTIICGGAISISVGDTLEGRALTVNGAVNIANGGIGVLVYTPVGCGSPYLTGPAAPTFVASKSYAIFSSNGNVTDDGTSHIMGDVGGNTAAPTGYNPDSVTGAIHGIDVSTAAAAADLLNVYDTLNLSRPYDIKLLDPTEFGHNLVVTPHTYQLNPATTLTDTVYLDAMGNTSAVFIFKIYGAFNTIPGAKVALVNGTLAKNVYWLVDGGAVSITANSIFNGTLIVNNGAIDILPGAIFHGRALTTDGAISTTAMNTSIPPIINAEPQPDKQTACVGTSVSFTVVASGTSLKYKWRKGNTNLVDGGHISGVTNDTLTINQVSLNDADSMYNVIVYEAYMPNDTSTNVSLVVGQPAAPTVGTITQPTCKIATGSVLLTGLPAGNWTINPGAIKGSTKKTLTALASGTHNYTVSTVSGCNSAASVNVVIAAQPETPTKPTLGTTMQPTCTTATGTITVSSSKTGLSFSSDGSTYTNTSGVFDLLKTGKYSVSAKNVSGCISTAASATIDAQPVTPAAPTASATLQPTCSTATGTITVSSSKTGLVFSIDGSSYTNTSGIFTLVKANTYSVTAKNASGCISTGTSAKINAQPATPLKPTVTLAQPTSTVLTGMITVTAPKAAGMMYSIDGSTYTNTDGMFMAVAAGTYSVTAKNADGCISPMESATLTEFTTGIPSVNDGSSNSAVTIYPNPFTTSIDIIINDASLINTCELRVYNVLGKQVINTNVTKQLSTLQVNRLPSGIYFYKVMSNGATIQSGKMISK